MSQKFAELGISRDALEAVKKMGYTDPTPVQEQAIPEILKGHDVCAAAATGTGKTAAFLLPTMSALGHAVVNKNAVSGPRMLVLTPTRELAEQIGDVCKSISRETDHYVATLYGGTKYGPQINKLRKGVDIIIATPGRLIDLRERGVVNLSDIDVLVIDEADRMLDMGFWPSMETIIAQTPKERQTLLFSATLDRKVMRKVSPILKDPVMVEIAHRGDTAKTVEQYILPIENKKKQELLQAVLGEHAFSRVVVFTRTKKRAEECNDMLRHAGFASDSIHSDKPQHKRKRALERFTNGKTNILVATDVLARGIDVPSVDYVVNYDLPDMAEDYVHRIGRTGRAGEVGFAVSFVTRESRSELRDIESLIGREIPMMEIDSYDVDPGILETKNKNKHGKKKRVRERDIERSRAHNASTQGSDFEDGPAPKKFDGLAGYKTRSNAKPGKGKNGGGKGSRSDKPGKGGKSFGNKGGRSDKFEKKSTAFDKFDKRNKGNKGGCSQGDCGDFTVRDAKRSDRGSKGNDRNWRDDNRGSKGGNGFGNRQRNDRNFGDRDNRRGGNGGRRDDNRGSKRNYFDEENRNYRGGKRGSASHKKRFDSPKPASRQGMAKAKQSQGSFSRFYNKNGN